MSNLSSEYGDNFSQDDSLEVVGSGKYIKKLKSYKKKGVKMISSTLKKKKCQFYNEGTCTKGSLCKFSHSFIPDVAKKICKSFMNNSCVRGDLCPYSHNLKRYPCKFFHIQRKCDLADQCRFSHKQVDSENEDEFLMDNQEFLAKIHRQGESLQNKFIEYIQKNDLLNGSPKKVEQNSHLTSAFPFMFGLPLVRTFTREDFKIQPAKSQYKKSPNAKKPPIYQNIFSIRMVYKNRIQIPERLPTSDQDKSESMNKQNRALQSASHSSKNEFYGIGSNKISQGIQLTPEEKVNRAPGIEQFVCSYY